MNCERFQTVVNDLAREQNGSLRGTSVMEVNERAAALKHALVCEVCALEWEGQRNLTAGLWCLSVEMKSLAAPSQLEANVLAAFREQSNAGPAVKSVVRPFPAQRPMRRYWIAAIAALLLIVLGMVVVRRGVQPRSKPQVAKDVPAPAAPHANERPRVNDQLEQRTTVKDSIERPVNSPRRNPRYLMASQPSVSARSKPLNTTVPTETPTNDANSEIATDFFPIGYGTTPNLQEGGQLLRVELPRAAVARFGLPVNMDRAGERVKADVLVGADGLAQAIRFVH